MKEKIILALAIALGSDYALASCPRNLNGRWAGDRVVSDSTRLTFEDGQAAYTNEVLNNLFVYEFKGGSVRTLYHAVSGTGIYGEFTGGPENTETLPVVFDRSTCSGSIGDVQSGQGFYFIVTDNGKLMKLIGHKRVEGKVGSIGLNGAKACLTTLYRQ